MKLRSCKLLSCCKGSILKLLKEHEFTLGSHLDVVSFAEWELALFLAFFFFFLAAPTAYGGSHARDWIRATAVTYQLWQRLIFKPLCHSRNSLFLTFLAYRFLWASPRSHGIEYCSCVHTDTQIYVQFLDTPVSLKPYKDVKLRDPSTTCCGSQARSSFWPFQFEPGGNRVDNLMLLESFQS